MFASFLSDVSGKIWGAPFIAFLAVCGIYLSISAGFVQLRPKTVIKSVFGGFFGRKSAKKVELSPFEAVCTALAGTVGTGNITGVAVALSLGGAGALFWMWISAIIGMGTKYAEILLAFKYRERGENGEYLGGAMYAIKNGLSGRFYPLAVMFALAGAMAAFGTGNMVQVGSIVSAVKSVTDVLCPKVGDYTHFRACVGFAAAAAVTVFSAGGTGSRGRALSVIVPFMAAFYLIGAGAVIAANIRLVPAALRSVLEGALSARAVMSGAAGRAVSWGFRRGMLSHEAGLGSSPMAHASAETKSPPSEGLFGVFEVAADTLVISTVTALMLLVSDGSAADITGMAWVTSALSGVFGESSSAVFLAVSLTLFAFSSVLSWSIYGERCAAFLAGNKGAAAYRAVFVCVVFLSSVVDFSVIIDAADILNAFMTLPNVASLVLLAPVVRRETRRLF